MAKSSIEWLRTYLNETEFVEGETLNPWIGCTKVSAGCLHCYAERDNKKRKWNPYGWGKGIPRHRTANSTWNKVNTLNKKAKAVGIRYKLFCASLADVLDDEVPTEWRRDLWELLIPLDHIQILFLTKRVENALTMIPHKIKSKVWMGFSASNQETFDSRWAIVKSAGWFKKFPLVFVSLEPMIDRIVLPADFLKNKNAWVIAGGESGDWDVKVRPLPLEHARRIRDQCIKFEIPFFFKQWGEYRPARIGMYPDYREASMISTRVGRKVAGRLLDGREWNQMPEK